jgi:predicted nucleic acid-binding protein
MSEFVVDASYAAAWCFDDEATAATDRMFRRAAASGIVVPSIWKFEIANLIRSAERRQRLTQAQSDFRLTALATLVVLDDESSQDRTWTDVLALARAHVLTVYDAAYVELALRLRLPLATRDKVMAEAALALKIEIVVA